MIPLILVGDDKNQLQKILKKYQGQIITIKLEKKEYSIEQIREIKKEVYVYYNNLRVYFFPEFHKSSIEAQHAFLKLLEEPPSNVQFILTVPNINFLLPTIISRSKVVNISKKNKIQLPIKEKIFSTGFPINCYSPQEAIELLNNLIFFLKENLTKNSFNYLILKETLKVKGLIENNNINYQLAIDHLLIFIKRMYNDYRI